MMKRMKNVLLYLGFAGISTFLFAAVTMFSFLYGIFLTFTDWNGMSSTYNFVGISNYTNAARDSEMWASLFVTFRYVLFVAVITNVVAFAIAYALTRGLKGQNLYRGGFFTPNLIGGIILGVVWRFIFSGFFTRIGSDFGIPLFEKNWLSAPKTAFAALVLVSIWQMAGYLMIIYMAGLIGIPKDILEASTIDGASGLIKFTKITLPLVMPSITICGFLTIQRTFMSYDLNFALTKGGPFGSTRLVAMHVYNTAFVSEKYGIGQVQALILFVIVTVITVTQVYFSKKAEVEA